MWQYNTLDKFGIASRGRSQHRPRNDASLFGGKYPFIQTGDVKKYDLYITEFEQTYNEKGLAQSKLWDEGTLCITIAANIADTGILGIKACFPDSIIGFTPNEKCDIKFLKYSFDILQTYCKQISRGTTQDNLSWQKLSRIKFPNPPLPTQQKIASILSAYDNLIQNYKKQIEALQTAASELYKEWFVRFRFPGYQTTNFENGIPEGWKVVLASELGEFIRGKNITAEEMQEGTIPVISAGIEPSGFHNQSNVKGVSLTISNSGANAGYLQINYSDIWAADCSYCNSAKHIYFYYELLNNMRVVLFNLQKGAAQPHVYAKDINKMKILLPSTELIGTANKKIKLMHEKIYSLQQQITNLTQQRDLLVPRLMSGKLEV